MTRVDRILAWLARPLSYKVASIAKRVDAASYRLWCRIRGYDFDGMVPKAELDGRNAQSLAESTSYQAYPVRQTIALVDLALRHQPGCACFVDVGCGKGKQCVYVARRFDFDRIIGIDFSPSLIATAENNRRISGRQNIECEVADACEWRLPDERCVVFFYNPFGEGVMRSFIENNISHFRHHGSIIAYGNDLLRDVLVEMGFEQAHRSAALSNSLFVIPRSAPK